MRKLATFYGNTEDLSEQLKLLWHNRNKWGYSSVGREKIKMSGGHFYDERRSFLNE